jgi:hypothetical protein
MAERERLRGDLIENKFTFIQDFWDLRIKWLGEQYGGFLYFRMNEKNFKKIFFIGTAEIPEMSHVYGSRALSLLSAQDPHNPNFWKYFLEEIRRKGEQEREKQISKIRYEISKKFLFQKKII